MPSSSAATAAAFVQSVLALKPRIAVFDCDGTLWRGDSGADFFYWEIEKGLIPSEMAAHMLRRYDGYKSGEVDELTVCGEMVTMHDGLAIDDIRVAAREFFAGNVAHRIFPEMQELVRCLAEKGCEVWAVSSTNNWVVEEGVRRFGIPAERVLAAEVEVENGRATNRLIQVPTDELKEVAIKTHIKRPVDAVFGNSVHDAAMLAVARHPFAVNPNPDLVTLAEERGWTIYQPQY